MKSWVRTFLTNRVVAFALWLFRVQIFSLRARARHYYLKCSSNCRVACAIEVWSKITGGRPLDFDSALYKQIGSVADHYLYRSYRARTEPTFYERLILAYDFAYASQTSATSTEAKRHFKFVLRHRLAKIIKRYENIHKYIALVAAQEVTKAERFRNELPSAEYWRATVNVATLPEHLKPTQRARWLLWRLRRARRRIQTELAQGNYSKIDFTTADVSSLVALSGTLLLFLGYLRIAVLGWYLGIPYEKYFTITDYLASSISSVQTYLISGAISISVWWIVYFASINAYAVNEHALVQRSFGWRLNNWSFHFLTFTCVLAAIALYFSVGFLDATGPMSVVAMYLSFYCLAYLSRVYFLNPMRAYLYGSLVVICVINGLFGALREVRSVVSFDTVAPARTLKFDEIEYQKPAWRVLAITSGFVILRRQLDGVIHVQNKSGLKSIIDSARPPIN